MARQFDRKRSFESSEKILKWNKIGLVFTSEKSNSWMNSHAQVPTVMNLGDILRVFFSTRDEKGISRVACLDVDARNPINIKQIYENPILDLGDAGCFDEHGVMPSCVIPNPGDSKQQLLFYSGWSRRLEVPYSNLAGVAVSDNGINFKRVGKGPVLTTKLFEPYSATSPYVVQKGDDYNMYYSSGTSWQKINGKLEHTYNIKKATSKNGLDWEQLNQVCFKENHPEEAITRPTILELNGMSHMWFCFRGSRDFRGGDDSYRIGYANLGENENWVRDDSLAGITISKNGWDSQMVAYPYVVKTNYGVYMFYNGNGFGRSGFGVAVLDI